MDLNHRPPGPEPGALTRLSHAPTGAQAKIHRPSETIRLTYAYRQRIAGRRVHAPPGSRSPTVATAMAIDRSQLQKLDDYRWLVPRALRAGMRTDALIYADERLLSQILSDLSI